MKLKRFLLRYYPPGIILEYEKVDGTITSKAINLLNLTPDTDIEYTADQVIYDQPTLADKKDKLVCLIKSTCFIRAYGKTTLH